MKVKTIKPQHIEFVPEHLSEGVLYISERFQIAVHKCCCGCGQEVVTPLSPAEWSITYHDGNVSLSPSIGNWNYKCRSHYIIRNGKVLQAKEMNERQIQRVKMNDRIDRAEQIRLRNDAKAATIDTEGSHVASTSELEPKNSGLQRLICWWQSLK